MIVLAPQWPIRPSCSNLLIPRSAIDTSGLVTSRRNGFAIVIARASSGVADTATMVVAQKVASMQVTRDSLSFAALQAIQPAAVVPLDRLGSPVTTVSVAYAIADPAVASVTGTGTVRALWQWHDSCHGIPHRRNRRA